MVDMGMKNAKTMKIEDQKLDEALYIWFRQQREKGVPITGLKLMEKLSFCSPCMLYLNSDKVFTASTGFLFATTVILYAPLLHN